jgi:hypothetical protein
MLSYRGLDIAVGGDLPYLGGNIKVGDPFTYCPSVWQYVIDRFGIETVLGSGCGNASSYFHRRGLKVLAVDGYAPSVLTSTYPAIRYDLTIAPVVTKVDLTYCHEVVEHVEEKYLDNLISSLLTGRIVLMTHALPGREGHHHVNLKPREYWIEEIERRGARFLEEDSTRVRTLAAVDRAPYMEQTGLVFANTATL